MAGGGVRTAVFLSGAELDQGLDLLASAAGRGVPLVAYLVNTARPGAGVSGDTGHEACHAAAETGVCVRVRARSRWSARAFWRCLG